MRIRIYSSSSSSFLLRLINLLIPLPRSSRRLIILFLFPLSTYLFHLPPPRSSLKGWKSRKQIAKIGRKIDIKWKKTETERTYSSSSSSFLLPHDSSILILFPTDVNFPRPFTSFQKLITSFLCLSAGERGRGEEEEDKNMRGKYITEKIIYKNVKQTSNTRFRAENKCLPRVCEVWGRYFLRTPCRKFTKKKMCNNGKIYNIFSKAWCCFLGFLPGPDYEALQYSPNRNHGPIEVQLRVALFSFIDLLVR